jgi:hypothetical protein
MYRFKKTNYELKKNKQTNKPKNLFRTKITEIALNNNHSLNLNVKHAEVVINIEYRYLIVPYTGFFNMNDG